MRVNLRWKEVSIGLMLILGMILAGCAAPAAPAAPAPAAGGEAAAAPMGELVPKIEVLSQTQAEEAIEFETTRLLVENMRQLGLDVEQNATPWSELSNVVWFERDDWQMTAWRMVGRPERMDPDEFIFNLFHSSTAESGYNFVGFLNEQYDQLATEQRGETDQEARRQLIYDAQQIIAEEVPYIFVAHPQNLSAYRSDIWNPDTILDAQGIGIKNFWTWIGAEPLGDQKDLIVNTTMALVSINPLYIAGDNTSRVTELIWDRVMRIGPDGLTEPWAAESVTWEDETNVVVKLREGMLWHDGEPVTADDLIFSFQAPAGEEAPMYKPFVSRIANIEKIDDLTARFTLTEPWVAFETASLAKLNLIPKHIWEPIIADLETKPDENAESIVLNAIGSGPYRFVDWSDLNQLILERNPDHWAAPKAERWIIRVIPNQESALGQLRSGELNFLMEFSGDPTVLQALADEDPNIEMVATTDLGFRFFGMNERKAPFDDVAFRRAIAHVMPKDAVVKNIFKGYGVPADSHVSLAIDYWHNPDLPQYDFNIEEAKQILMDAGYTYDADGMLHMPAE